MRRVVTLRSKYGVYKNEIEVEPLTDRLFLEFGSRVGEGYEYVSLMRGNPDYTRQNQAKQLYFTHRVLGTWRVFDDSCLRLVEDYCTKELAVDRLRQLAKELIEGGDKSVETRALQLEVVEKPGTTEEPRVMAHIYADDDCSPVAQVYAIPLSRISVVIKAELGSPYCSNVWNLGTLIELARKERG